MPGTVLGAGVTTVSTVSCGALFIWSLLTLQLPDSAQHTVGD